MNLSFFDLILFVYNEFYPKITQQLFKHKFNITIDKVIYIYIFLILSMLNWNIFSLTQQQMQPL